MVRERGEKLDRRRGSDDPFVVLRSGLESLRRVLRGGIETRRIERLDERALTPQYADVRPIELIGRAGEIVAADCLRVDEDVRRVVDSVDERQRADGVGELCGACDVSDRAK